MKVDFKHLTILLFFSLFFMAFTACESKENDKNIAPKDLHKNWQEKDFTLLDVRSPEEFSEGFIKGAQLIPVNSNDFSEKVEKLPKDKPVVVYCHSGPRATKAAGLLKEAGFEKIYLLDGSFSAWKEAGLPIEK